MLRIRRITLQSLCSYFSLHCICKFRYAMLLLLLSFFLLSLEFFTACKKSWCKKGNNEKKHTHNVNETTKRLKQQPESWRAYIICVYGILYITGMENCGVKQQQKILFLQDFSFTGFCFFFFCFDSRENQSIFI